MLPLSFCDIHVQDKNLRAAARNNEWTRLVKAPCRVLIKDTQGHQGSSSKTPYKVLISVLEQLAMASPGGARNYDLGNA